MPVTFGEGGFQHRRDVLKPVVAHQPRKRLQADRSLSNFFMPVYPASALPFAVVQVEARDPFDAQALIQTVHERLITLWRAQVVASRVEVAGVQTDADAFS